MGVRTIYVDDFSGDEVRDKSTMSKVRFVVDGQEYSFDVTEKSKNAFKTSVKKWIDRAEEEEDDHGESPLRRELGSTLPGAAKTSQTVKAQWIGRVRGWGQAQGLQVSDKGRISQEVKDKYIAANPEDLEPGTPEFDKAKEAATTEAKPA